MQMFMREIGMKFKWFGLAVFLVLLAVQARGETVHLSSGEVLKGRSVIIEADAISIESDSGVGVIQIQKSDVILIE